MNEKAKHTPGPWMIVEASKCDVRSESRHICYTGPVEPIGYPRHYANEDRANASRIVACVNGCEGIADPSAVRELLEALEALVVQEDWEGDDVLPDSPIAKARAAIAKARGEKGGGL